MIVQPEHVVSRRVDVRTVHLPVALVQVFVPNTMGATQSLFPDEYSSSTGDQIPFIVGLSVRPLTMVSKRFH